MLESLFPLGIQHYLIGGLLIAAGVSLIFILTGAVSGMSTVFSSTWSFLSQQPFFQQARFTRTRVWRLVLAAGSLQLPSLLAVLTFLVTAITVANLVLWLGGA